MDKEGKPVSWSRIRDRVLSDKKSTPHRKAGQGKKSPNFRSFEEREAERLGKLHRRSIFFELLLLAAAITLALGLTLPVVELSWMLVWKKSHSILDVTMVLFREKEYFLSVVLFTFSVLFPILKLLYLLFAYTQYLRNDRPQGLTMTHLHWLGKWSMLDVLVLALLVFYVKQSGIADAQTLPAIYFFAAAVILTMLSTSRCEQHIRPM